MPGLRFAILSLSVAVVLVAASRSLAQEQGAVLAQPVAMPSPPVAALPLAAQDVNSLAKGTVYRLVTQKEKATTAQSHGSAFVVDRGGLLISNYHVVQDALLGGKSYRLLLEVPGGTVPIVVVAVDLVNDLALLRTGHAFDNFLQVAKATSKDAEIVYSLGYPGSEKLTFAQGNFGGESVNGFSVSGFASLPLNPGMSGGPLLNSRAEVIGVNRAIVNGAQNLSFFSPLSALQDLIAKHGGGGRTLASIAGSWKKDVVAMVQKQESGVLFGKATTLPRHRLGGISFAVPLVNQVCGQTEIREKSDGAAKEILICRSRSLSPLVGGANALEVSTYALSSGKAMVDNGREPLLRHFGLLYEKERKEILRGTRVRLPAALSREDSEGRQSCALKNVKNAKGVQMTVSLCSVANAFFDGLFSTFVKVDVQGSSRASLLQIYQGFTAPATADVLGQFLESIDTEEAGS